MWRGSRKPVVKHGTPFCNWYQKEETCMYGEASRFAHEIAPQAKGKLGHACPTWAWHFVNAGKGWCGFGGPHGPCAYSHELEVVLPGFTGRQTVACAKSSWG